MTDIFELAYSALDYAKKAGADEAEIYCIKGRSVTIDVHRDEIDLAKESLLQGIGIRVIVNGAVGFSSTNDPEHLNDACVLAVKSAKVRNFDPDWSGLPEKKRLPAVKDVFDRRIADIDIESCIDFTMDMIDGAKSVHHVEPTSGHLVCASSENLIINSHGVEIDQKDSISEASIDTIAKSASISTASEFDVSRKLDIDFYRIGEKASSLASRSQNGIPTESRDTVVLLEPLAFADILENTLISSLNADNVQKGRSALIGKMGSNIAAGELSIIDDGTFPGGIGTAASDDEGTPSKRNRVITKGVLSSFLYDCYTAGKEKKESTGNAVRGSFTSTPSVGIRNLIIEHPSFDIIADSRDGVVVNTVIGAHTANPISGDFSVEARNSFLIKNGEIHSPIKSMMISGNIFDVLQGIDGIGKDVRKVGNIITPTVRVSRMKIIG
ncbi:MAG: TldD/PmbA family protein [Candidatus Methanoperedens sp.]|nr:TldD/PmbA family protein [Candidatus Methanoperedens sp.]MCZ7369910.1 TldD/PmbA family protein [Candidatus Methanoperedens sp.]